MSRVAEAARAWLGTPYLHQASLKGAATDCLGLVRGVWREVHGGVHGAEPMAVPAYTPDWSEPEGDERLLLAATALLGPGTGGAGDLLVFRMREGCVAKHLGVQVSPATFVHAYARHGVVESSLSAPWAARVAARLDLESGPKSKV